MNLHWENVTRLCKPIKKDISKNRYYRKQAIGSMLLVHVAYSAWVKECVEQRILDNILGVLSFSAYEAGSLCWDHLAVLIKGLKERAAEWNRFPF